MSCTFDGITMNLVDIWLPGPDNIKVSNISIELWQIFTTSNCQTLEKFISHQKYLTTLFLQKIPNLR